MSNGIEIKGMQQAVNDLKSYGEEVEKDLSKTATEATINIEREAKKEAPVDEARLKTSIHRTSNGLEGTVSAGTKYAPFVEFGTGTKVEVPSELQDYAAQFKGGGDGDFDDLIERIEGWASRHGLPESAVYPIALKIVREGTEAQPFMYPAAEKERPKFRSRVKKILKDHS